MEISGKVSGINEPGNFGQIFVKKNKKDRIIRFPLRDDRHQSIIPGLKNQMPVIVQVDESEWAEEHDIYQAHSHRLASPEEMPTVSPRAPEPVSGFVYPYNFITPAKPLFMKRPAEYLHDRFHGGDRHSGKIICDLETLSPLFIPDAEGWEFEMVGDDHDKEHWKKPFFRVPDANPQGSPAIPGSSLKGMVRSAVEAASNACFAIFDEKRFAYRLRRNRTTLKKDYHYSTTDLLRRLGRRITGDPDTYLPCSDPLKACPACQLFGSVFADPKRADDDITSTTRPAKQALAGRVYFSTARIIHQEGVLAKIPLRNLAGPKPKYYPFYLTDENAANDYDPHQSYPAGDCSWNDEKARLRGAKRWWLHHDPEGAPSWSHYLSQHPYASTQEPWIPELISDQNLTAEVLPAGSRFQFSIEFENLSVTELGLLLFSLDFKTSEEPQEAELTRKYGHQIGMGKPLGMGVARLAVHSVRLFDRKARYRLLLGEGDLRNEGLVLECLSEARKAFVRALCQANGCGVDDFGKIDNIRDLLHISDVTKPDHAPVRYRPNNLRPDKNFMFFGGGKADLQEYVNPRVPLPKILEIAEEGKCLPDGYMKAIR